VAKTSKDVKEFYDGASKNYHKKYDPSKALITDNYSADRFRLNIIIKRFKEEDISGKIIDFGVGDGVAAKTIYESANIDTWACDISSEMIKICKNNFELSGMNSNQIMNIDVADNTQFKEIKSVAPFNAAICLGVMPHVPDVKVALKNISSLLSNKGRAFISFRNSLFSMFTMNKFTHDFIINDLLSDTNNDIKKMVSDDLKSRMEMDKPKPRVLGDAGARGYDTIPAKFHNPLEAEKLFQECGFKNIKIHFYHYHAGYPLLETDNNTRKLLRQASINLEGSNNWQGNFLCSAYLVEALV